MTLTTIEQKIMKLIDRAEITDLIGKYTYGMDSRDWDLYRSVWTDEIELDFGDVDLFNAPIGMMNADDWVRALQEFFRGMNASQHLKIPVCFTFSDDGDRCETLSLMRGKHWMPNQSGDPLHTVVGYYRDRFIRTQAGWRQNYIKELVHWNEGNAHVINTAVMPLIHSVNETLAARGLAPVG